MSTSTNNKKATRKSAKPPVKFNPDLIHTPIEYYKNIAGFKITKNSGWQNFLCPFHQENSPSFGIHLDTGGFNCLACGAKGGSIISFHMRKYGLTFKQTIKALGAIGE